LSFSGAIASRSGAKIALQRIGSVQGPSDQEADTAKNEYGGDANNNGFVSIFEFHDSTIQI